MLARNEEPFDDDGDDGRLYKETCKVHRAVYKRLEGNLWDRLSLVDRVSREAAFLGTMTALTHYALWMRTLWEAFDAHDGKREPVSAEEDRAEFVKFAGACWDDFQHEE